MVREERKTRAQTAVEERDRSKTPTRKESKAVKEAPKKTLGTRSKTKSVEKKKAPAAVKGKRTSVTPIKKV